MKPTYSKTIMASYATFKELYNSKKYHSPYQILSEFINSIIISDSLYSFTSSDIQLRLLDEFGFDLPIAVICTALKSIKAVKKTETGYSVNDIHENTDFRNFQQQSEDKSNSVINDLIKFADNKGINTLDKKTLSQAIRFRDFTNSVSWGKINTSSKQAKQIAEEKTKTIRKTDYEERSNGDEDLQY